MSFHLLLREREFVTLADMKNDVVKVEVNMVVAKRSNTGKGILKEEDQPSASLDVEFDSIMKTMENLMDRLTLGHNPTISQPKTLIRNPNFRRPKIQ